MRTYGRANVLDGNGRPIFVNGRAVKRWVEVDTDANGYDDNVWLTTLCQVLLLNLNESPFYANWGIPARQSVLQQVPPDFWVTFTQQNFSQYFASLIIAREPINDPPTYRINVITQQGAKLNFTLGVPY